jgi:Mn-dependent DtxR family transcriptional regulator
VKPQEEVLNEKLDRVIGLLQHLLALELSKGGINKAEIGKHLKVAKSSVVKMLHGYGEDKS